MNYSVPWYACKDDSALEAELKREIPRGHVLFGVSIASLARRQDCDDVLLQLLDGSKRVAVVHLTYSIESNPSWPNAQVYPSLDVFLATRMVEDAAEFGE